MNLYIFIENHVVVDIDCRKDVRMWFTVHWIKKSWYLYSFSSRMTDITWFSSLFDDVQSSGPAFLDKGGCLLAFEVIWMRREGSCRRFEFRDWKDCGNSFDLRLILQSARVGLAHETLWRRMMPSTLIHTSAFSSSNCAVSYWAISNGSLSVILTKHLNA